MTRREDSQIGERNTPAGGPPTLRESTLRGVRDIGVATYAARGASLVSLLVLARLLSPADFGIAAVALIIGNFANTVSDFGLTATVVSRGESPSHSSVRRVARYRISFGLLAFAILFLLADVLAGLLGSPASGAAIRALSPLVLITGAAFAPQVDLQRSRDFKQIAKGKIVGSAAQALSTVAAAIISASYWAIVVGQLVGALASTLTNWWSWRGRHVMGAGELATRAILFAGGLLTASWLSAFVLFTVDRMMVSVRFGAEQLGYYALALQWATFAADSIAPIVGAVGLPTFASLSNEVGRMKTTYLATIRMIGFVAIPASVGLLVVSPELLVTILGGGSSKWLPGLQVLQILTFLGLLRSIVEPASGVLLATGTFTRYVWIAAVQFATFVAAAFAFLAVSPRIESIAAAMVVGYAVDMLLIYRAIGKVLSIRAAEFLKTLWGPAAAGSVMLVILSPFRAALSPSWVSLVSLALAGSFLYFLVLIVLRQREIIREFSSAIRVVLRFRAG